MGHVGKTRRGMDGGMMRGKKAKTIKRAVRAIGMANGINSPVILKKVAQRAKKSKNNAK